MAPSYNTQQKAAISQFMNFTNADRNTAIRFLKQNNWNQEVAVNGYFSGAAQANTAPAKAALAKIFDKYRDDPTVPDSIGATGTMNYLGDIGVDPEGIGFLAVSEIVQSPSMGEMTREGFVDGWTSLSCTTTDQQQAYVKNLLNTLSTSTDSYTKIYKHTFQLARQGTNQKAVALDMAIVYWSILFTSPQSAVKWSTSSTPWLEWWTEFLNTSWKKSVNRDMWTQTLVFAKQSLQDEKLSFWSEEASWPSVIDEFVEWVKNKRGEGAAGEAMEE